MIKFPSSTNHQTIVLLTNATHKIEMTTSKFTLATFYENQADAQHASIKLCSISTNQCTISSIIGERNTMKMVISTICCSTKGHFAYLFANTWSHNHPSILCHHWASNFYTLLKIKSKKIQDNIAVSCCWSMSSSKTRCSDLYIWSSHLPQLEWVKFPGSIRCCCVL